MLRPMRLLARISIFGAALSMLLDGVNTLVLPLQLSERMNQQTQATTHLNGDFEAEVAAYDTIHNLALEMADFISAGIIKQFPNKFRGDN